MRDATVHTVDDDLPRAEAFAIKSGRFLAVGSSADVSNLIGPGTEVIDAAGRTVVPGFIDAHNHPFYSGTKHLKQVSLDVRSIDAITSALAERAQNTPPGQWVQGFLYDDTKLEDGRPLTRADLDDAVPDHPVSVTHRGGHTGVYNSRAFDLAGITADTPDPPGGRYYREDGELTGRVAEHAKDPLERLIPAATTRAERRRASASSARAWPRPGSPPCTRPVPATTSSATKTRTRRASSTSAPTSSPTRTTPPASSRPSRRPASAPASGTSG